MNSNCEIVRDLLPLYHDGVCGESSKKMVQEHLAHCDQCNQILGKIKDEGIITQIKREARGVVTKHKKANTGKIVFWSINAFMAFVSIIMILPVMMYDEPMFLLALMPALHVSALIIFFIGRRVKGNKMTRTGVCLIAGAVVIFIIQFVFDRLFSTTGFVVIAGVNLSNWENWETVNSNINLMATIFIGIIGAVLTALGISRGKNPA